MWNYVKEPIWTIYDAVSFHLYESFWSSMETKDLLDVAYHHAQNGSMSNLGSKL